MWSKTLQKASFRGIEFDCLAIDDEFDHAIVAHRYPYKAGADVEDMGRGPRQVEVQAIFFGDDYETTLEDFVTALAKPGAAELIHPVFGSINAQVVRGSIHHEADHVDQGFLSFTLLESTAGNPFFTAQTAAQSAQAVSQQGLLARLAAASSLNDVMNALKAANPLSQLLALRQAMIGPIAQMLAIVSSVATSALDVISSPTSWASNLTALAAGIADVASFAPANLVSSYKQSVGRLAAVLPTVSIAVVIDPVKPTEAQAIAAAQIQMRVELACTVADCAAAVFASEAVSPTLTPAAIESITNSARDVIEGTILAVQFAYPVEFAHPIVEGLKSTALAVQQAAQAIIVLLPPLIAREVLSETSIHLLAFLWYGDHTRSSQLQLLNGFSNPNFLPVWLQVTGYAS